MAIATPVVRRTGIVVLLLAALAILLIAPGAISAEETGSEGGTTEEPVWSADMVVVEYTSVSIGAASADLFSNIGGSADLQIKSLWSHIPDRDLRLNFEDGVPDAADYTLQVGGLNLEFSEGSSGESSFKWTGVDVDWEDGETIQVRITPTPAPGKPPLNTLPTGAPTISGTTAVGKRLTAHTDEIADAEGMEEVTFRYQWNVDQADISGATRSSYTLALADEGKTIRVRVRFTDDAGNDETLVSKPTEAIGPQDYHGNSMETATALELDTPVDGVIHEPDDVDFFKIVLTKPTQIWARLNGPNHYRSPHNRAVILDVDGDEAGFNSPTGSGARPGAGTYFVKVHRSEWDRDDKLGPDPYTLRVQVIPEHGDTIETATQLDQTLAQWDSTDPHKLRGPDDAWSEHNPIIQVAYYHSVSDRDFFKLELPTATIVRVRVVGPWILHTAREGWGRFSGAIVANNVHLFDSNGNAVEPVMNGFPSSQEGRVFHLDAGTHYFGLSPYSDEYSGPSNFLGWYRLILYPVDAGGNARGGICNRTEQVRRAILGKLPEISFTECELVTQAHLDGTAGTLYLQDGRIHHLNAEDFEGLPLLQSVLLAHNDLTSLPDDGFDDLSNLEVLSLSHNDLTSLPDGIFDNLSSLRVLHLGHNQLASLPDGIFDNLTELEVLSLVSNDLSDLPEGIFNKLTSLRELYLGGNSLSALPDGALDDPSSLEVLSFSGEPPSLVQRTLSNNQPSGLPVILGKASVGRTLWANSSGIIDPDCYDIRVIDFSYQWIRVDGTTETEIEGATGATYRLSQADVGKTFKVRVRYTDDAGHDETLASDASSVVVEVPVDDGEGICVRQPKVQSAILAKLPDVTDCALVTNADLEGITGKMQLATTRYISDLQASDFEGLSNLQQLSIYQVQHLTALPSGVFAHLTNLEELYLMNNKNLTTVPAGTFEGLANLRLLKIEQNTDLATIEPGLFDDLTNLQTLRIRFNAIAELPDGVFDDLADLRTLDLQHNSLTELPDRVFDNLFKLRELILLQNELQVLPSGVFDSLFELRTLFLNRNEIASLPEAVFDDLAELEGLWLNSNALTELPDGAFDDLADLRTLDLQHNSLTELPDRVFDGPVNLHALYLNYNRLASLPDGVFDGMGKLERLEFYVNNLTELPDGVFDDLTNLQILHMAYNRLNSLPASGFGELSKLKILSVDHNELASLQEGTFEGMTNLERLYLESNPGAPFALTTELEQLGDNSAVVKVDEAAPFDTEVVISAEGGVLSNGTTTETVTVEAGTTTSEPITVTLQEGSTQVTVSPQSAIFLSGKYQGIHASVGPAHVIVPTAPQLQTAATILPTISGTAQVGETLTADTSGIADEDGLENAAFAYQWVADDADIEGATGPTYEPTDDDVGKSIRVRVSFTDDAGNEENLTSEPTAAVAAKPNTPATGQPTITGTAQVGETLTADTSGISDADGLENAAFSYQWTADDADIDGATTPTYEPTDDDAGKTIKVRVSLTDDAGNEEILTSEATAAVADKPNTPATGAPTIGGTAQVGETLTADTSGISDADGLDNAAFSYQWLADDTNIQGAANSTYTLAESDVGKAIKVKVSFTDDAGNDESLTSAATGAVAATANSPATGLPTISGTAQVGETLTADTSGIADEDGLDNAAFAYQWVADDADIQGATNSTYTLADSEEGKTVKVRATFTDDDGHEETLTSAATAAVTYAAGPPGAPGEVGVQVGDSELQVTWQAPADENKAPVERYRIQYREEGGSSREVHTTLTIHTLGNLTNGVAYMVQVEAENAAGYGPASAEMSATPRAEVTTEPDTPQNLTGKAVYHRRVSLDWDDVFGADSYEVQFYDWDVRALVVLPHGDVTVAFSGSSAVADHLTGTSFWWLQVRAVNAAGVSEWSKMVQILATKESDWKTEEANNPATGLPAISGTAQVGETLTADTSVIADEDGLENAVFSYQWIADDADIDGATTPTYEPTDDDVGKSIRVRVSFTDDAGNEENLTSEPTAAVAAKPNTPATGQPTITGTAQVGETLTADTSGISDADGLENAAFSYQWTADDADIDGATTPTYEPTDDDAGKTIKVRVSLTDDAGNEEILTSEATAAVADKPNTPATGAPTIGGTAQVGETLTADTSGISDADGLDNAAFSYQWLADDTNIQGAANSTYTLAESDVGKAIKVKVSFTDDAGNDESLTSAATGAVAATANSPATGLPTISGTAQVGETLTADTSGIADEDGLDNAAFAYQWVADDADIQGATNSTYTLVSADVGKAIRVRVTFTDDDGHEETLTSEPTAAVAAKPNGPATGQPAITGTAQVGETLTADTSGIADADGLDNAVFGYQWVADDAHIDGAVNSTYSLADGDVGKTIRVKVSFTDDAGNAETLTSDATAAVAAAPLPLTVSLENRPSGHDGTSDFTFEIRFSEDVKLSYQTLRDHAFVVTGGSVKKAQRMDKPSNIPWRITVRPDGNGDVVIELPVTTDCNAQGAVCTKDDSGRMLSNSLSFTVSGPGQ